MVNTDIVTAVQLAFFRRSVNGKIELEVAVEELSGLKGMSMWKFANVFDALTSQVKLYHGGKMDKDIFWKFAKIVFSGVLERDIDEELEEMEDEIMSLENQIEDLQYEINELRKKQKSESTNLNWML